MENYQKEQQLSQAKILASYSDNSIKKAQEILVPEKKEDIIALEKSQDNDIEKGKKGEGSRGGKVIGHTKSGKPIYDVDPKETNSVSGREGYHSDFVDNHKHFTPEDHKDAHAAHMEEHQKEGGKYHEHYNSVTGDEWNDDNNEKGKAAREGTREASNEQEKHSKLAKWHKEASEEKEDEGKYGKSIGKTSSGKHVRENKEGGNYGSDFSKNDHKQAADIHKNHEKENPNHGIEKRYQHLHRAASSDEEKEKLFDSYLKEHKSKKGKDSTLKKSDFDLSDIEKAEINDIEKGGEGSKGGKVVGHTKSGKAIYEGKHASEYNHYTEEDHDDASLTHYNEAKKHGAKHFDTKKGWSSEDEMKASWAKHQLSQSHNQASNEMRWKRQGDEQIAKKEKKEKEIKKSESSIEIGSVSVDGKFVKGEDGNWERFEAYDGDDVSKGGVGSGKHKYGDVSMYSRRKELGGGYGSSAKINGAKHPIVLSKEELKHYETLKGVQAQSAYIKQLHLGKYEETNKKEITKGIEIGTVSPDGKFQKGEDGGWHKIEK